MLRGWLSWLGGLVIIAALVLIALAARDLVLAADVVRVEHAHGDLYTNAAAREAPWHHADDAPHASEHPALLLREPGGPGSA